MANREVSLLKLHIGRFSGLTDLSLSFRPDKPNLVIAANRAGKTSVCEFLRFMFYGIDEENRCYFPWDGERTVSGSLSILVGGARYDISRMQSGEGGGHVSVVAVDSEREVELGELSPGEYFLGIDAWLYDRTVYFQQKQNAKIQADLSVKTLDRFAALFSDGTGLYSQVQQLTEEKNLLMNKEKTGEIDRLMVRRKEYETRMARCERRRADIDEAQKQLAECNAKMADSSRRIVLLKAELKSRGDLQAASSVTALKEEIESNEARLRNIAASAHIGEILPNRVAAEELRMQYADYCRLNARITESKEKLMLSEDNLKFHGNLFAGVDTDAQTVEDAKRHIDRGRRMRVLFLSFSLFFLLVGIGAFAYLYFSETFTILQAGIVGLSLLIFAAILGLCASIFRMRSERLLEEFDIESLDDFYDVYDQFIAHKRTDALYQEQVEKERAHIKKLTAQAEETLSGLSRFAPGCSGAQQICAACVSLLETYATFCELGERIKELREKYRDITSSTPPVDEEGKVDETLALERELLQLSQRNESLFAQKTALETHLADMRAEGDPAQELAELVSQNERGLLTLLEQYRTLEMSLELAKDALNRFEKSVKTPIAEEINAMLSFAVEPGESFEFGDSFELRYKRGDKRFALSEAGGGLSELAHIAMRLCIARRALPHGLFLVFDESFSYIDEKSKRQLAEYFRKHYTQFLIFASGSDVVSAFSDGAVIQTFGAAL